MTEAQIKHMVDRFLGWRLPENFNPDGGISFKKTFNDHMPFGPQKHEPSGTNLFDVDQADAMVRYMIDGMPAASEAIIEAARAEADRFFAKECTVEKACYVDGAQFALRAISQPSN